MPKPWYRQHDPDTGRFITKARWEELREETTEESDDWEDLDDFEDFPEEEY